MQITIETSSYNRRRCGKPWIATVDFAAEKKGTFSFGDWIGQAGGSGTLEIEAAPGTIIARGQKDLYKSANSAPEFFLVQPTGEAKYIGDKGAAYKTWKESQAKPVESPLTGYADGDLLAECRRRNLI